MTPDERELRRALDARSGEPGPAFRARLSAALAQGRPSTDLRPALAVAAAVLLAVATVGVVLLSRYAGGPTPARGGVIASPSVPPSPPPTTAASSPTASIPPTSPPGAIVLPATAQLSAPDGTVVWAFFTSCNSPSSCHRLFRSTDRGATWQERTAPPPLTEVSFVSDEVGWAANVAPAAARCQGEGPATIWHTTDGGSSWQTVASVGAAPCKGGLSFVDATHGFLATGDNAGAPVIYRTADGGRTWTASRPLPDPPGGRVVALWPGRVRAFGSTLLVEAGDNAGAEYVYRSTDAGASWTYLAGLPHYPGPTTFVTASRWLQLSSPPMETLDAGATWHAATSTYTQAAPVAPDVVFGSPQVGYATVRGQIQRTSDGGATWTDLHTPGT